MKEFHKDINGKWIPSWSFLHFGLTCLVIRNGNEILKILKLQISKCTNLKQSGGDVVLDMIVLRRPVECISEKNYKEVKKLKM